MDGSFGVEVFNYDEIVVVIDDARGECFRILDILYKTVAAVVGVARFSRCCHDWRL